MTLNCIWWWGSSSGALENVEYFFIAITLGSSLKRSGSICKGQIGLFENYQYLIGILETTQKQMIIDKKMFYETLKIWLWLESSICKGIKFWRLFTYKELLCY